jgi:hypothetical protein
MGSCKAQTPIVRDSHRRQAHRAWPGPSNTSVQLRTAKPAVCCNGLLGCRIYHNRLFLSAEYLRSKRACSVTHLGGRGVGPEAPKHHRPDEAEGPKGMSSTSEHEVGRCRSPESPFGPRSGGAHWHGPDPRRSRAASSHPTEPQPCPTARPTGWHPNNPHVRCTTSLIDQDPRERLPGHNTDPNRHPWSAR